MEYFRLAGQERLEEVTEILNEQALQIAVQKALLVKTVGSNSHGGVEEQKTW